MTRPSKSYPTSHSDIEPLVCLWLYTLFQLYDWEPVFYDDPDHLPDDMPLDLKDHITNATAQEVSNRSIIQQYNKNICRQ